MIFRLSQALNARVKTGTLEALPQHENPLFDWSAHLFPVGRSRFILLSITVSLLSAVVSGQGVTRSSSGTRTTPARFTHHAHPKVAEVKASSDR